MTSISDVMNFLFDNAGSHLAPKVLAGLFDQMLWILNDENGAGINEVRQEWLLGRDSRRVEVALLMDEIFPFDGRARMEQEFIKIREEWPHLGDICDQILKQWDMQFRS